MRRQLRNLRSARFHRRRGIAAVECALTIPLLTLLVLGAIDVGQFANVYQKVSDASREGARVAARNGTGSASQVQEAVMNYLAETSPDSSSAALVAATTVSLSDAAGSPISGSTLSAVSTGSPVMVRVTVNFDSVRWIGHLPGLNGSQITATTTMRRE